MHCSATVGHFISIFLFGCHIIDDLPASIDDGKALLAGSSTATPPVPWRGGEGRGEGGSNDSLSSLTLSTLLDDYCQLHMEFPPLAPPPPIKSRLKLSRMILLRRDPESGSLNPGLRVEWWCQSGRLIELLIVVAGGRCRMRVKPHTDTTRDRRR